MNFMKKLLVVVVVLAIAPIVLFNHKKAQWQAQRSSHKADQAQEG